MSLCVLLFLERTGRKRDGELREFDLYDFFNRPAGETIELAEKETLLELLPIDPNLGLALKHELAESGVGGYELNCVG